MTRSELGMLHDIKVDLFRMDNSELWMHLEDDPKSHRVLQLLDVLQSKLGKQLEGFTFRPVDPTTVI